MWMNLGCMASTGRTLVVKRCPVVGVRHRRLIACEREDGSMPVEGCVIVRGEKADVVRLGLQSFV